MKKLTFLILFLIVSLNCFASQDERYLVEKNDGSVVIAIYQPGSKDSLSDFLNSAGLGGLNATRLNESDYPSDRSERQFWGRSFTGKKIGIDQTKKQATQDEKTAKESKKDAILSKLKITRQELKDLMS